MRRYGNRYGSISIFVSVVRPRSYPCKYLPRDKGLENGTIVESLWHIARIPHSSAGTSVMTTGFHPPPLPIMQFNLSHGSVCCASRAPTRLTLSCGQPPLPSFVFSSTWRCLDPGERRLPWGHTPSRAPEEGLAPVSRVTPCFNPKEKKTGRQLA